MVLPELVEEPETLTPSLDTTDADDTLVPAARYAIHTPAEAVLWGLFFVAFLFLVLLILIARW